MLLRLVEGRCCNHHKRLLWEVVEVGIVGGEMRGKRGEKERSAWEGCCSAWEVKKGRFQG